ncbi:MAG: hypothetical protein HGA80_03650 [Candidatus Omnitrophica bacterium]|nr:hypothetical protein [Candidatus Omnitrophota bacterium]
MRKNVLLIIAAMFLSTIFTGISSACDGPSCTKEFTIFRIVGAEGSKKEQTTFSLNETPWVYVKIANKKDKVSTEWLNQLDKTFVTKWTSVNKKGEAWISLAAWNSINDKNKIGTWTISGFIGEATRHGYKINDKICPAEASFVVTPEPISMVLYGMGGLPLAAHFLRRRKQLSA